jgi:putative ABC transport system permease protein
MKKQVVAMFVWVFVKIFLVAAIIAIPVAYFASYKWLEDFAHKRVRGVVSGK